MKIKTLSCDIETYSSIDLRKSGVYRYCESPDFEILLFGYSVNGGEVQVVDFTADELLPPEILAALTDDEVEKWAFNAQFERICLSRYLGTWLKPDSWKCTMVWSAYMGLPLSLVGVGSVLGLEKQKLEEGKDLIRYFCMPCKPTKANGGRIRNLPSHAADRWEAFKAYNARDVETELEIQKRLEKFPVPDEEWHNYILDQEINDRGISLDLDLVKTAIDLDNRARVELMEEMKGLTHLENPNSVAQLKMWLGKRGVAAESLDKAAVQEFIESVPEEVKRVLELRQSLAKSSVRKYASMENVVCSDGRARGLLQFYGANRTGRFAGRLIQVQNLPRNNLVDLNEARALVKTGELEIIEALYNNVPPLLSELIRTAFIPKPGHEFIVADFSAIERVVLAWLAGESWVLDAYKAKEDLYIATASRMFGVPQNKIDKKSDLRQKGKVADLACIAEGQLVLTDAGLVPIEEVSLEHKVWDGANFVNHEGVIFNGEKEVISYGGLTATKDHLVWVKGESEPVPFGYAVAKGLQLFGSGKDECFEPKKARVYDILNAGPNHRYTVSGVLVHNCGYGGSVGALKAMGALDMGLREDELKPLVDIWRRANPRIVQMWWDVDKAAITAVRGRTNTQTHGIRFECRSGMLFISLPSGRKLCYVKPRIGRNRFGSDSINFEGIGATKKWERIETYGAKLVENIVQAISRDLLCYAMQNLNAAGFPIVMHIHDEVVIEAPKGESVERVCDIMTQNPPWASGLPLRADGFISSFYKKD